MKEPSTVWRPSEFLASIRKRPGLYFGEKSLSGLHFFLSGYTMGSGNEEVPWDFFDWVAYRCGFRQSTSGWRAMILERTPDEEEAFDRCFELLDEYQQREPRVIARLDHFPVITFSCDGKYPVESRPDPPIVGISLVSYTDDPGFFPQTDSGEMFPFYRFCPDLEDFYWITKAKRTDLTILDPERFARVTRP